MKIKQSNQGIALKKYYKNTDNPKCGFQKGHKINKGKVYSKEQRKAYENYWKNKKGKTYEEIMGEKQAKLLKEKQSNMRQKEKHPNWKNGTSFEPYSVDWTKTLKRSIKERDNFKCKVCNDEGNFIHHIDYNKKNCNVDNLITLCNSCHSKTNYNRKHWIKYFKNKIKEED